MDSMLHASTTSVAAAAPLGRRGMRPPESVFAFTAFIPVVLVSTHGAGAF